MENHILTPHKHYKFSIWLKIMFCLRLVIAPAKRKQEKLPYGGGVMITRKYLCKHFSYCREFRLLLLPLPVQWMTQIINILWWFLSTSPSARPLTPATVWLRERNRARFSATIAARESDSEILLQLLTTMDETFHYVLVVRSFSGEGKKKLLSYLFQFVIYGKSHIREREQTEKKIQFSTRREKNSSNWISRFNSFSLSAARRASSINTAAESFLIFRWPSPWVPFRIKIPSGKLTVKLPFHLRFTINIRNPCFEALWGGADVGLAKPERSFMWSTILFVKIRAVFPARLSFRCCACKPWLFPCSTWLRSMLSHHLEGEHRKANKHTSNDFPSNIHNGK